MENFLYEDIFCGDLGDLLDALAIDGKDDLAKLSDSWSTKVMLTELQPMFTLSKSDIVNIADMFTTNYEERFSEDGDKQYEAIEATLLKHITPDIIDKINADIPKLYYPVDKESIITKQDLIEFYES